MADKVVVYLEPVLRLARTQPFDIARIVYPFLSLLKEQYIRDRFGVCRLLERIVRQANRAEKFRTLRHVLSCHGVEFVHCTFARHHRHDAVRLHPVDALGDKVIVDHEFLTRILAVIHAIPAERNVPDHYIEIVLRKARFLEALDLYFCLRVQFCRDFSRHLVQFHAVQSCTVRNLLRHIPKKITRSHCGFQNAVVALDAETL